VCAAIAQEGEPPSPAIGHGVGDSLAIEFDALAASLRGAISIGDGPAVRRLHAALESLLARVDGVLGASGRDRGQP
jgi:hypothetical protein